jgi:hypothetical protein
MTLEEERAAGQEIQKKKFSVMCYAAHQLSELYGKKNTSLPLCFLFIINKAVLTPPKLPNP